MKIKIKDVEPFVSLKTGQRFSYENNNRGRHDRMHTLLQWHYAVSADNSLAILLSRFSSFVLKPLNFLNGLISPFKRDFDKNGGPFKLSARFSLFAGNLSQRFYKFALGRHVLKNTPSPITFKEEILVTLVEYLSDTANFARANPSIVNKIATDSFKSAEVKKQFFDQIFSSINRQQKDLANRYNKTAGNNIPGSKWFFRENALIKQDAFMTRMELELVLCALAKMQCKIIAYGVDHYGHEAPGKWTLKEWQNLPLWITDEAIREIREIIPEKMAAYEQKRLAELERGISVSSLASQEDNFYALEV